MAEEAKWYVVHTYSGYENKVKVDIEKTIENRNLQDQILEVMVPMQTVVEERNGEKKPVPLTAEEITNMGFLAQAEEVPYSIGDHVLVTKGVWQDTHGIVQEVHPAKHMAVIEIDMFGRGTPVEIDFSELEKL